MTEREAMSCEHCRQLLSDLVCGELGARDEEKARAHVAGCGECAKALAAFQRTIWAAAEVPLDEPSAALDVRIMAAAEAQLRAAQPLRTLSPARIALGAWLARVGEWAMSPQVAMASVLVLVVGIGLYALPLAQPSERAALAPAAEPPAAASPPDAPLGTGAALPTPSKAEEARDKKSATRPAGGRSGPAPRSDDARLRDRFAQPPPASSGEIGRARRGASVAGAGSAAHEGAADDAFGSVRAAPVAKPRAEAESAPKEERKTERALSESSAPAELAEADKRAVEPDAPAPAKGAADSANAIQAAPAGSAPAAEAPAQASANAGLASVAAPSDGAAPPAPSTAPAAPKPPSERAELARGMQALTAGRLSQAINVLAPLARAGSDEVRDLAQALLAEALHDANRCSEALPWFARIVTRATTSARSLELAADCYAKTGRDAKADELRKRARSR